MTAAAPVTPKHLLWRADGAVAVIRPVRPDRKNPMTFDSYAELSDAGAEAAGGLNRSPG